MLKPVYKSGMTKVITLNLFILQIIANDQIGSPLFVDVTRNTIPWEKSIEFARDPNTSSNAYFANFAEADHWRNTASNFGPGDRQQRALFVNGMANTVMTAAQTDPRSTEFISQSLGNAINSGKYPITSHESMNGDKGESDLNSLQYGDPNNRYIDAISIEPQLGYYQTADNEQAFQATYDNIQLGRAEEALFLKDENSSKEYFNKQLEEFKNENDKQTIASDYQKEGILRSRNTAGKFRDYFEFKESVSQHNLGLMPTKDSLLANCRSNTKQEMDKYGVYNYIMEPVFSYYDFEPPESNVDSCDLYVNNQQEFLVKNQSVQKKLNDIIKDSQKMSEGLNEIDQKLSDESLSIAEIAEFLGENQSWKELANRHEAWKKCATDNCLDEKEKKVKSLLNYEGALDGTNLGTTNLRNRIRHIVSSGELPSDIRAASQKIRGFKLNKGVTSTEVANMNNKGKFKKRKEYESIKELSKGSDLSKQISKRYIASSKGRSSSGVSYVSAQRDQGGVLRSKTGKVIPGFEAPAHHDLFKIISIRYRKKFFGK